MCGAIEQRRAGEQSRLSAARGFTLLELMIVLAIMVLLIALVWPSLRRPVLRHAVQQAAQQLVRDLARARMAAIDHGRIMALRYEPGGSRYVVSPADMLQRDDQSSPQAMIQDTADDQKTSDDAEAEAGFTRELDPDVVFRDPAETDDDELPAGSTLREMLEQENQEREEIKPRITTEKSEETLSPPVFFYPTGRAENAEFVLLGPNELRLTVKLRGLTGAATIGPLEHPPARGTGGTATPANGTAATRSGTANRQPDATSERPARREQFTPPDAPAPRRTRPGAL
jgi:type II secretion system protein H